MENVPLVLKRSRCTVTISKKTPRSSVWSLTAPCQCPVVIQSWKCTLIHSLFHSSITRIVSIRDFSVLLVSVMAFVVTSVCNVLYRVPTSNKLSVKSRIHARMAGSTWYKSVAAGSPLVHLLYLPHLCFFEGFFLHIYLLHRLFWYRFNKVFNKNKPRKKWIVSAQKMQRWKRTFTRQHRRAAVMLTTETVWSKIRGKNGGGSCRCWNILV